jgi:hypothetical protein
MALLGSRRTPPTRGRVVAWAALLAALLLPGRAHATSNFPAELQSHLGLRSTPDCTLCHTTSLGGVGTVTKPFGQSMRAHGLVAFDTGSLDRALDALASINADSDGDCIPDIQELKQGADPNVPNADAGRCTPTGGGSGELLPRYGCGARVAPENDEGATVGGLAIACLLVANAARRRRGRQER